MSKRAFIATIALSLFIAVTTPAFGETDNDQPQPRTTSSTQNIWISAAKSVWQGVTEDNDKAAQEAEERENKERAARHHEKSAEEQELQKALHKPIEDENR